ncbi:Apoptosis-antagonizing transcription factor, C-terminal domain containing protein [Elaphomyces granulatus]
MTRNTRPGMSLLDQIADLEDPTPRDFDPEDQDRGGQTSDEDSHLEFDEKAGREHYLAVGKGKLRKAETIKLGKQYAGSYVSRQNLEADIGDDDSSAQFSAEEDDSGPKDSGQEDVGSDDSGNSEGTGGFDTADSGSEVMSKDEDLDDLEHEFSDSEDNFPLNPRISDEREEVRRLMSSDQKMVSATISQATKADAVKGIAVKQQRATFDGLLNTRIKLQKGLMAINDLSSTSEDITSADEMAIKSAESAALALWSTIEDLRLALADSLSKDQSKKRKRPSPVSSATPSASLWKRMTDLESESLAQRRTILDKWSLKVRGSTAVLPNARGKLLGDSGNQQMLTAVIDAHIASESGDRPVKRHRQIRLPNGNDEAPELLYDDTVFYQSLLRDLVEQRMSSSDAITNGVDSLHLQLPHSTSGMRKDKIKKIVDTKASKGRKMRYNVHEKLQNFMAPEDRGTWSIKAREEFFASLLGKTASRLLGEDNEEERMNGATSEDSEVEKEECLRLFGSS